MIDMDAKLLEWLKPLPDPEITDDVRDAMIAASEAKQYKIAAEIAFRNRALGRVCICCGSLTRELSSFVTLDEKLNLQLPRISMQVHDEIIYELDTKDIHVFCKVCAMQIANPQLNVRVNAVKPSGTISFLDKWPTI